MRGRTVSILRFVFGAILTAMATPFDADLRVDEAATVALAHHLVEHGSDGLVMAGTTGEASTLTDDEKVALYRIAVREVGGRASVVAGTGSNDTAHSVHLTRLAAEAGVDAVLVVTPYYNRPPRAGIAGHVAAIAEVGVPVILYNIPGRSGVNMEPDLIAELAQIPNQIEVNGYTNQLPASTYPYPSGWELSSARASAVVRYLVAHKIAEPRLSATGYSDLDPLVNPDDPPSVTRKRRVDIVVMSTLPDAAGDALAAAVKAGGSSGELPTGTATGPATQ